MSDSLLKKKTPHARLHILLASDSPTALVIRHGTAKAVCTLSWDRKTDKFYLGQWMRGRIDTATCDLSPNGAHFLYTARKYKYVAPIGQLTAWTVVARVPYLKAVAYYPDRSRGGWFLNRQEYIVAGPNQDNPDDLESPEVRRIAAAADAPTPAPSLYAARLIRSGWTMQDLQSQFVNRIEFTKPAGAG